MKWEAWIIKLRIRSVKKQVELKHLSFKFVNLFIELEKLS